METKTALESESESEGGLAATLNSLSVSTPDQGSVTDTRDAVKDTVSDTVSDRVSGTLAISAPHTTPGAFQHVVRCIRV